ncbi:hypothetical protein GCM10011586_29100 [Silvibacterium dinghuense]|nr:hypothetical protein GCM10011586_29100 [Silvibacterium dinghuense]
MPVECLRTATDAPAQTRIATVVDIILDTVANGNHRAIIGHIITRMSFDHGTMSTSLSSIRKCFVHIAHAGTHEGVFRKDSSLVWDLLSGVMHAAATHLLHHPEKYPRVRDEVVHIMLSALRLSQNK